MSKNNFDIVILTDNRYVNPTNTNWYINQVLIEDQLLAKYLLKEGLSVCRKDWADPNFDFSTCKFAIFRTPWDYFERFDEFFQWIEKTKKVTTFINSPDIIKWNIDKIYLLELKEKGINIAPTIFINKNDKTLYQLLRNTEWKKAVIKPAISGAARHTYLINNSNYNKYENIFQEITKKECMLFQEFMENITIQGEISLIMIGGEYTHAVRKIAKKGDFRVQDDHGGKVLEHVATKQEIIFAKECIKKCPYNPIYARVDIVYDNKGEPALSELELIEPELWFRNNPEAAAILAKKISQIINKV